MIKTIIFDLSEVVLRGLLGTEEVISKQLNIPAPDAARGTGVNRTRPELMRRLFLGEITEEDYINTILKTTKWSISSQELKGIIRNNMQPIVGMLEILNNINPGVEKALLTNHAREWCEYCIKEYNLSQYFGNRIYGSYDIKILKPNPKAIKFVLEKLNTPKTHTLFIDDSLENIQSAKTLGLKTHHFTYVTDLVNLLQKLKLLNSTQ